MSNDTSNAFSRFVKECVARRKWTISETARRAAITQPEMARIVNGTRPPTLRHVRGLANGFFSSPSEEAAGEPPTLAEWWMRLGELAETVRRERRDRQRKS